MNMSQKSRTRRPTTPGEVLNEEFLLPLNMTQRALAEKMGYEVKAINRLIHGHSKVTPAMALALSRALGPSPKFWLNLQNAVDIFDLEMEQAEPARVEG